MALGGVALGEQAEEGVAARELCEVAASGFNAHRTATAHAVGIDEGEMVATIDDIVEDV